MLIVEENIKEYQRKGNEPYFDNSDTCALSLALSLIRWGFFYCCSLYIGLF
jgi:hypothetical protein